MRLIAELFSPSDTVRWLILESDEHDTKGWFLFGHPALEEPSSFDYWFQTVEEAKQFASKCWGISQHDWRAAQE